MIGRQFNVVPQRPSGLAEVSLAGQYQGTGKPDRARCHYEPGDNLQIELPKGADPSEEKTDPCRILNENIFSDA